MIFPSSQPINELASAIKNKIAGMNNSKEWIPAIFAPTDKGREGVVTITFTKPDAPGYDCTVGFEFNSNYAKIIDPQAGFPEEVTNSFGNILELFLGWQNGKEGRFNESIFTELKKVFISRLTELEINKGKSKEVPIENKNGVDPMLNNSGSNETPNAEVTTDTGVPLPF